MSKSKAKANGWKEVTIYTRGMFGMCLKRAYLVEHGTSKWAQYPNSPYVVYLEKGKRTVMKLRPDSFNVYLLIVEGWNAPELDDPFGAPEVNTLSDGQQVTTRKGLYSSCDPRWETDLDAKLAAAGVKIVADYRHSSGFDVYKAVEPQLASREANAV